MRYLTNDNIIIISGIRYTEPYDVGVLGWVRHRVQQGLGLLRSQVAPLGVLTAGFVTASVLPGYVLGVSLVSGLWAASLAAVLQTVDD